MLTLLRTHNCVVSAVLPVEIRVALRRRATEQTLDVKRVPAILKRFAADRQFWTVIEVSGEVLATAETLGAVHSASPAPGARASAFGGRVS